MPLMITRPTPKADLPADTVYLDTAQTLTQKIMSALSNTFSGFRHGTEVDNPAVAHGATGAVVGTTNIQTLTNKTITMAGALDMAGNYITNSADGIVRIGNSTSLARLRLSGFFAASPADPPASETDIIIVDVGATQVLRIRYNDAGVMKVGDLALI